MSKEEIEHIIKRYLDGTATPEERCQVDQWYEALGDQKRDLYLPDSGELNEALSNNFAALKAKLDTLGSA